MIAQTLPVFDHFAAGHLMRLSEYVRMCRSKASDAAWNGNDTAARVYAREADEAVQAGLDPVPMF